LNARGLKSSVLSGARLSKGAEPEMVVVFKVGNTEYAAVALERAHGIALVSLRDPARPRVVAALGGGNTGVFPATNGQGPEGLAHLKDMFTGDHYIYTANEVSGTVSIFRVRSDD